jgi:2-dehydro-3-deoxyphosphogluconate aldolase/(4S)-4-hydroxy-2-oxoglutarate aldolase
MIEKLDLLNRILKTGVVAVVRAGSEEEAVKIVDAASAGGITALEVTMTVPGAIEVIKEVAGRYAGGEEIIGAGTVLDAETARLAILSGAKFIVGPTINRGMIRLCNRYQINCIPGAASVTEVSFALELGASLVKIFPGGVLKPDFIKAIRGPMPFAPIIPATIVTTLCPCISCWMTWNTCNRLIPLQMRNKYRRFYGSG